MEGSGRQFPENTALLGAGKGAGDRQQDVGASIMLPLFLALDSLMLTLLCAQANKGSRPSEADSCAGPDSPSSEIMACLPANPFSTLEMRD